MHPLLLTPLYPPATGGAASYFGMIAERLADADGIKKVTLLTEQMPGEPEVSQQGRLEIHRLLPTRVSVERGGLSDGLSYLATQRWMQCNLKNFVQDCGATLFHFHTRYQGPLFFRALHGLKVPVIADLRDKFAQMDRLSKSSDFLLCCGEGVQNYAVDCGYPKVRTRMVPIPFEAADPTPVAEVESLAAQAALDGHPFVLFVGDMNYNKGVFDLITAFENWQPAHPDVNLLLVGTNRQGKRFEDVIAHSLQGFWLGSQQRATVLALMNQAKVVCLPSRSEGLPRVILEAVAQGTPVICPPDIPEFDRWLPDHVLPEVNPEAILTALDQTIGQPLRSTYPLEQHRLEHVIQGILGLYLESLTEKASA